MTSAKVLLLAWIALLASPEVTAQAAAGRVLVAAGDVFVIRAGREARAAAQDALQSGDVVRTGTASSAQLGFNDGAIVAMRAGSRFEIAEYRFTGADDGTSQSVFRLLQGGIRTLTGLIGRSRPDRYRMNTPLATVGIRGTAFSLVQCDDDCEADDGSKAPDGSYGVVFEGRVAVANLGGELEFGTDEAFFVPDARTAPQALVARPRFLRDRLEARARAEERREAAMQARADALAAQREQFLAGLQDKRPDIDARPVAVIGSSASPIVVAELRDSSGNIALLGPGLGAGVAFATASTPAAIVDGGSGTVIRLDASRGLLDGFAFNGGAQKGDRLTTAVVDNGRLDGDGGAVWGRWAPGAAVEVNGQSGIPPTGVAFFFGNLTPEALFGAVPAAATAVRYELAGGPRPVDGQGQPGQMLAANFIVNFVNRTLSGAIEYQLGPVDYTLPVPAGTALVGSRGFVGFNVTAQNAGQWQAPSASGTFDNYTVSGLFLGSRAQGLGVTFATQDTQTGRTAGVAILRCTSGGCR